MSEEEDRKSGETSLRRHFDDIVASNLRLAETTQALSHSTARYARWLFVCAVLTLSAQLITYAYLAQMSNRMERLEEKVFR